MNFRAAFMALVLGATLSVVHMPVPVAAQSEALNRIKERAELLRQYREMLASEDPNIVDATFEEAIKSKDATIRKMALEVALGSQNKRLQTKGVRYLLMNKTLILTPITPDNPDKAQEAAYNLHKGWAMKVKYDASSDTFEGGGGTGTLVQGGFNLVYRLRFSQTGNCEMQVRVASPILLTGSVTCALHEYDWEDFGTKKTTIPVKIELG